MKERIDNIQKLLGKRLRIFNSEDPEHPTRRGGIAFVLNKSLVNTEGTTFTKVIPGRTAILTMSWHKEEILTILAVYIPNIMASKAEENTTFWNKVYSFLENRQEIKIDILLGNLNVIENILDHLPS